MTEKTEKKQVTRVLFNTSKHLKEGAQKRAYKEGTDLTTVLNQAMALYAEGVFDPDDFITHADILAIRRGLADIKAEHFSTQEEVFKELGL